MNGFEFIENKLELITDNFITNKQNKLPWIEKYRPNNIDDIVSQDKIINSLKISLKSNNLPHLLFYGPPGTGKTSTILAIGRELFGPKIIKQRIIELNASDDRGINAVRDKIKLYAKKAICDTKEYKKNIKKKYPCPPYKIIILDEADSMTKDAQSALRKIMEDYSHITRFCFICNYINKIIEPISSRCASYCFFPLKKDLMGEKIKLIAKNEKIKFTNKMIERIVDISEGDMRKGIMMLQNFKYMHNMYYGKDIIAEMNGYMQSKEVKKILFNLKNNSFDNNVKIVDDIIASGYSVDYFLEQFFNILITDHDITDEMKSKICLHFSDNQMKIIDGADEYLQLMDILMYSFIIINKIM